MTTAAARPDVPRWPRYLKWGIVIGIALPLTWALIGVVSESSAEALRRAPGRIWTLVGALFPPDWSAAGSTFDKILESLYIAWIGTMIGALFSFPLALVAATNIAPRWLATPVRGMLSGIRAFPELVLAVVLIPSFGLGAFTGTLAIGLHSIGTLGKLTSEVVEGIDEGPLEAMQASGGDKLSQIRYGVLPQAMPTILAYWLYRFEINVRASAVLGVVGAGGVGAELVGRLRFRADWPKAGTVLILTVVTVLVIDAISGAIRRRIISGEPAGGGLGRIVKFFGGQRVKPKEIVPEAA
jgi:phosphonate transport system permease protein